ncbi:hypothetical protein MTP99_016907 [Tenebrio molitor]|nr:hypothetical protein MTP99_016907 [Tenebrio molitor]
MLGNFLGPTVDDEIRAWNLTPHSGVWFFTNLPSGIRKSALRRLGLDILDSSSSLTLFGPSTSHTLFSPFNHSPFQPLSQSRTDLTSLTKDQRQKAPPRTLSCLL